MIFDFMGLPKENGATDLQDSARLAGVMATFGFCPEGRILPIEKYFVLGKYVRHPLEIKYNFSRDQTLCLVAGFYFQGLRKLVDLKHVTGIDIFTPAHRGHIRRCKGLKASKFQDWWFWFDVWRAAKFDKMGEPNQILCQMMVADKKYLKYWLKHNPMWRASVEAYWNGWRNEPELGAKIIKVLEGYL